ncbi:MAG: hypothetical protein ACRYF2_26265 [Janthinobacterium lividum]
MSRPDNNDSPFSVDVLDEDRVRRALGLKSSGSSPTHQQRPEQARARHRFVADGAVPVVMLNRSDSETTGLKERLSAAEHALENERGAHANTRRALQEATQSNQSLQTRLGHNELSNGEVLRSEREGRRVAEAALVELRAALQAETARVKALEGMLAAAKANEAKIAEQPVISYKVAERRMAEPSDPASSGDADPVKAAPTLAEVKLRRDVKTSEPSARKSRSAAVKEPKPVRWWTPSYRAKQS